MKISSLSVKLLAAAGLLPLLLLAAAACGSGEPQEQTFELAIEHGSLVQEDSVLRVKQDDTVTMLVTADEPVSFHLHGYDLEMEAKPGAPATLEFIADATGSFRFTIHRGAEDHEMGEGMEHGADAGSCEPELPPGAPLPQLRLTASPGEGPGEIDVAVEVENFVLSSGSADTELATGHWHLYINGELKAMLEVTEATAVVPYSGEHQVMARLSDIKHCYYEIDAMTTVVVEEGDVGDKEGVTASGDHEEDGGEEEIDLGRLEVQPR
jgi:hypothetical protein